MLGLTERKILTERGDTEGREKGDNEFCVKHIEFGVPALCLGEMYKT